MACRSVSKKFAVLGDDTAFHITTAHAHLPQIESDLRTLLRLSPLECLQWINLNRHDIELVTLLKEVK